jgi:SAM-dependent methyltransferase
VPNFPPLRKYIFGILDQWIERHHLQPPFLDVGSGTGVLAAHMARAGWTGTAVDSSPLACAVARKLLSEWPAVRLMEDDLSALNERSFQTAFLMDILEHVRDDEAVLRSVRDRLLPGGTVVLLAPMNSSEWAHDDEIYGHFRRYEWSEIEDKLHRAGFDLVESRNVTVPFMWLFRRVYLRLLPRKAESALKDTLTAASSIYNPWNEKGLLRWLGVIAARGPWWFPLFKIQDIFARSRKGHAAMFLARKIDESQSPGPDDLAGHGFVSR